MSADHTCVVCISGESEDAGVDSLEAYMGNLGSHLDKGKRLELKQQLHSLIHVRT